MRLSRLVAWGAIAVLSSGVAHAADAAAPEKEQKAGAQKTFDAGSRLYDAHRYDEALTAFRASYQILASPNSHLMVARALRDLGRNVEAYTEYDSVAREAAAKGEKYESAGHAATEERDELRPKIALVTIKLAGDPAGVTVKVGETPIEPALLGTPIPHDPGPVAITASKADGSQARSEATLVAGGASDVALALVLPQAPPAPAAPAPAPAVTTVTPSGVPLRTWAYVAGGVGVVGLGAFGIFGAMSSSKYDSLNSSCPDHRCSADKQGDVDAGRRDQTIANVGLVLGVLGVGAGVTLFVISGSHGSQEAPATARNVEFSMSPRGLAVDGRF